MHSLVTGGAGFIGSHLVDLLTAEGHEVTVIDNLSSGSRANLVDAEESGNVNFIEADIRTFDFSSFFKNSDIDYVFNLAAQIDVRNSVEDPIGDCETNVLSLVKLADAAAKSNVKKIIQTSSGGSIYGKPTVFPTPETADILPESPYAAGKSASELYLMMFSRLYNLDCNIIAPANVYGPRQNPFGEAGVVAIFSQRLLERKPTQIFGDGQNTRDYVYVKDVARAFILAALTNVSGKRFNIGTGKETSDRKLHALIAAAANTTDRPQIAPARLGDVPRSSLDSTLAAQTLGWTPSFSLSEGIAETISYFQKSRRPS